MDFEEIKEEIKGIKNWKCLEIIRNLCIERLVNEFDITEEEAEE